ncbi:MAG: Sensor histidine kinase RcsC [Chroococcidiopsis cubana SAG 39.79]|uniref:histidine kinase n=1 Tax=Chroococcidiopsis cubana SAG 39.79 TaxID=388085 RepID=A0AB37ULR9_9CYAN|nr:ATP-binding protein [Chroococcidiopsis cubana]MDZ4874960.1 Sensor histidine kinase RcsC [Chroococcidiopsis cubana SAG 39.79]PSB60786.1 histidine kinase [Chroococcidiopsis cubana CCALA 043]RUT12337.1 hypothetical protein DSM107010_23470 [Chroococcidiopsis cubana SAG 39.79]
MGSRQVCTVFNDITERKQAEAQLRRAAELDAFRVKLSDALRSLSDAVEIHAAVTRIALNFFGADRCYYCEIIDGNAIIRRDAAREGLPSVAGVYPLSDFPIFKAVIDAGRPLVVEDAHTTDVLDEALRQLCCEMQVISFLNVPVIKEGKPAGVLCITQSTPRNWIALETELAQETAERIWAAVERARAEVGLRESEVKYRSLFESMNEGLAISELVRDESGRAVDARYLELNPAYERQTGFDRSSALDRLVSEIFPTYYCTWLENVERVLRTGQPERFEQFVPDNQKWFAFHVTPFGGADGFTVLYDDITERKRQEQEQAFLLRLSDALRPIADPVEVLRTAMDHVADHFEVDSAVYHEFDADSECVVTREGRTNSRIVMPSLWRLQDFGFYDDLIAGRTIYYDDTETDPRLQDSRESYRAARIRAGVGVALIKRGRLTAMLGITHSEPRHWIDADLRLLEEVAERTWAAVERARAEEALRESEIQRVREQSAREQERQRAENLAELDRAKTLFFSNVSHEFRTPLTLLLAPLQDALSDRVNPVAPPQRERLELAHRNAIRLLKLVNTLLDFSRIEAGRMEAVYEPTDLAMFTTELASVFRSAIERAGLRLIVDCPPLPEPVYVDREMWEKIVLNLLSNAFKFTLEGEIAVRLHQADSDRVRLQIQDTGTGIAPEELPHLFERFYQVRGAQARTHEGSGIGLALGYELIRLHGGSVDVSSVVGQGTCFTVTIPLGTAHLSSDRLRRVVGDRNTATRTLASTAIGAAPYVEEAERWLPADSAPPQPSEERGKNIVKVPLVKGNLGGSLGLQTDATFPSARILLVDDNADMRDYLTRILSEYVQVEVVADGAAALAAVQERVPDLVLSDVMMPGLDGFALLKALRADPQTREIPIILLSARAGEESIVEGLEAGADDYLIKPFSAAELVSRVNAHLQMAQLRGEALRQERTTSRRKDELLSTVSHELNTPLVAILGWTRLLRGSPPSQSMLMKSLETIERNAMLQAKLIQDLLDISRITAGKVRLSLQPVELQSVIENAIAAVKTAAIAKDIHLQWQPTDRNPSVTVLGDRDRLQQIICNLLTNAIKFTPESGSITVQLVVKESWESKVAEIGITDTGIGITTDFLPHVFDRFRQAEGADSAKGLGLGLAIARHLVELHNGTIHAESSGAGLGATFTVKLPILQE